MPESVEQPPFGRARHVQRRRRIARRATAQHHGNGAPGSAPLCRERTTGTRTSARRPAGASLPMRRRHRGAHQKKKPPAAGAAEGSPVTDAGPCSRRRCKAMVVTNHARPEPQAASPPADRAPPLRGWLRGSTCCHRDRCGPATLRRARNSCRRVPRLRPETGTAVLTAAPESPVGLPCTASGNPAGGSARAICCAPKSITRNCAQNWIDH